MRLLWIAFAALACFQYIAAAPNSYLNRAICETAECYEAANYFIDAMNTSVNPCDNFYDFVCGNYVANTAIPAGDNKISLITELQGRLEMSIKTIIEENSATLETKASQLIEKLYRGCLSNYGNNTLAIQSITDLLNELGGWPVLQNGDWSSVDWKEITYSLRRKGAKTNDLLAIYLDYDEYNATKYALYIYAPTFLISQASLQAGLNNTEVQAYKQKIVNLATALGATDAVYTEEMVVQLLEFEIQLANIAVISQEVNRTIAELESSYPNIPWRTYVASIIGTPNLELLDEDVLVINNIGYVQGLNTLLENASSQTIGSYLQFRASVNIFDLVGSGWGKRKPDNIRRFKTFVETRTPKDADTCVTLVRYSLPTAVSALYVNKHMTSSIKENITDMIPALKDAFINMIRDNSWFDEATKYKAEVKVRAMQSHVAYSDELLDNALVDAYYENLSLDDNYVNLQFNIHKFVTDESLKKLRDVPDKADWKTHSSVAIFNAYYYPLENSLQILAGFIHNPMFRHSNPNYMNYGAIGNAIGHEINHGFDAKGAKYDEFGQLNDWFTPGSAAEYRNRTECLRQQYFALHNNTLTSRLTLNEDISDAGGIQSSYVAYQFWISNNPEESFLPGLSYNQNQLFWISYARQWCANETQNYIDNIAPYQIHSRGKYRAVVPLTNSVQFAEDFNCPVDSFMNPSHKCRIW